MPSSQHSGCSLDVTGSGCGAEGINEKNNSIQLYKVNYLLYWLCILSPTQP